MCQWKVHIWWSASNLGPGVPIECRGLISDKYVMQTRLCSYRSSYSQRKLWFIKSVVWRTVCAHHALQNLDQSSGWLLLNWPNIGCFLLSSFSMLLPCRQWTVGLCWFSATYLCHWKSRSWTTWRHARATHVQGIARHVGTSFELLPSLYWHRCIDANIASTEGHAQHDMGRTYVMTNRPQGGEMYDICRS